jgi:hypothetical protein
MLVDKLGGIDFEKVDTTNKKRQQYDAKENPVSIYTAPVLKTGL